MQEFLGPNVKLPPLFGEFKRVKGSVRFFLPKHSRRTPVFEAEAIHHSQINMLAGRIDVQFRVKGANCTSRSVQPTIRAIPLTPSFPHFSPSRSLQPLELPRSPRSGEAKRVGLKCYGGRSQETMAQCSTCKRETRGTCTPSARPRRLSLRRTAASIWCRTMTLLCVSSGNSHCDIQSCAALRVLVKFHVKQMGERWVLNN